MRRGLALWWVIIRNYTPSAAMSSSSRGVQKLRFNQDFGCFAVSLDSGVRMFNVEPLTEHGRIDYDVIGGIAHAEMMDRTNLVALVAGGSAPRFPDRNVMMWDDVKRKVIYEIGLPSQVKSVRWRRNKLIVVLLNEIHIFYFPTLSSSVDPPPSPHHLSTFSTSHNPRGLCEVCSSVDSQLIVYPARQKGAILLKDLAYLDEEQQKGCANESVCNTHSHELTAIALSARGTLVATASAKGTIIRVHSTSTRELVAEFRRGADSANINCLCFSLDSEYLLCSSDKATVHVFAVKDQTLNKKSSLPAVGLLSRAVSSYTDSLWGLAQFTLPKEGQCVCAFSGSKSVVALCVDGSYHKYTFTTDGNCARDSFSMFLDMFDDQM